MRRNNAIYTAISSSSSPFVSIRTFTNNRNFLQWEKDRAKWFTGKSNSKVKFDSLSTINSLSFHCSSTNKYLFLPVHADLTLQHSDHSHTQQIKTVSGAWIPFSHSMFVKRSSCFLLHNSKYLRENLLPANFTSVQSTNRFISITSKVSENFVLFFFYSGEIGFNTCFNRIIRKKQTGAFWLRIFGHFSFWFGAFLVNFPDINLDLVKFSLFSDSICYFSHLKNDFFRPSRFFTFHFIEFVSNQFYFATH